MPLLSQDQKQALGTLMERLTDNRVTFIAIGGLASIAWGSRRPLVDIDIQVSEANMKKVREIFASQVKIDLRHFQNVHWDIQQMVIEIGSQSVDICSSADFYVKSGGIKYQVNDTLSRAVVREVEGLKIPVMPRAELMRYKELLRRDVDLIDLKSLEI